MRPEPKADPTTGAPPKAGDLKATEVKAEPDDSVVELVAELEGVRLPVRLGVAVPGGVRLPERLGVAEGVASHGVAEPVKGVVGDQVVVAAKDVPLHDAAEGRIGAVLLSDGSEP